MEGRRLGKQCLLNDPGLAGLAPSFAPVAAVPVESGERCRTATATSLHRACSSRSWQGVEGIQPGCGRSSASSYQLPLYMERNRNFRKRGFFTANVIVIQSHMGA